MGAEIGPLNELRAWADYCSGLLGTAQGGPSAAQVCSCLRGSAQPQLRAAYLLLR